MKKIFLFFLFTVVLVGYAQAQKKSALTFQSYTWFEGLEEAEKSNKSLLVFIIQKGCDYCKELKEKTFTDSSLVAFLQNNYVLVSHSFSSKYGRAFALDFGLYTLPALIAQKPASNEKPLILYGVIPADTLEMKLRTVAFPEK